MQDAKENFNHFIEAMLEIYSNVPDDRKLQFERAIFPLPSIWDEEKQRFALQSKLHYHWFLLLYYRKEEETDQYPRVFWNINEHDDPAINAAKKIANDNKYARFIFETFIFSFESAKFAVGRSNGAKRQTNNSSYITYPKSMADFIKARMTDFRRKDLREKLEKTNEEFVYQESKVFFLGYFYDAGLEGFCKTLEDFRSFCIYSWMNGTAQEALKTFIMQSETIPRRYKAIFDKKFLEAKKSDSDNNNKKKPRGRPPKKLNELQNPSAKRLESRVKALEAVIFQNVESEIINDNLPPPSPYVNPQTMQRVSVPQDDFDLENQEYHPVPLTYETTSSETVVISEDSLPVGSSEEAVPNNTSVQDQSLEYGPNHMENPNPDPRLSQTFFQKTCTPITAITSLGTPFSFNFGNGSPTNNPQPTPSIYLNIQNNVELASANQTTPLNQPIPAQVISMTPKHFISDDNQVVDNAAKKRKKNDDITILVSPPEKQIGQEKDKSIQEKTTASVSTVTVQLPTSNAATILNCYSLVAKGDYPANTLLAFYEEMFQLMNESNMGPEVFSKKIKDILEIKNETNLNPNDFVETTRDLFTLARGSGLSFQDFVQSVVDSCRPSQPCTPQSL